MDNTSTELLTLDELCETLMIGRSTAYQLLKSGELGAFRIGRIWKIPKTGLMKYLQNRVIENNKHTATHFPV